MSSGGQMGGAGGSNPNPFSQSFGGMQQQQNLAQNQASQLGQTPGMQMGGSQNLGNQGSWGSGAIGSAPPQFQPVAQPQPAQLPQQQMQPTVQPQRTAPPALPYNQALRASGFMPAVQQQEQAWRQQAAQLGVPYHQLGSVLGQQQGGQMGLGSLLGGGQRPNPSDVMSQLQNYNHSYAMNQQALNQNYDPVKQQQLRQSQDADYANMLKQNQGIDQSTYQGFIAQNALRAARPQTNAGGWNDIARARSRSAAFAQMTPQEWAERQASIAKQLEESRTGRVV